MADTQLSKRERQIMDIVWALGEASATHVLDQLNDPPTRTAVRTFLRILEEKGHLKHRKEGREFVYSAVRARQREGQSALKRVLSVFFDGSLEKLVAAHLADPNAKLSSDEARGLAELITQAKNRKQRQ